MTDAEFMAWVVLRAYQRGSIGAQTAIAALNAIEAGNFIPANFPAAVTALQAAQAYLTNLHDNVLPPMIAQAQNLQTSTTPI